jgi:hypothetical protein
LGLATGIPKPSRERDSTNPEFPVFPNRSPRTQLSVVL